MLIAHVGWELRKQRRPIAKMTIREISPGMQAYFEYELMAKIKSIALKINPVVMAMYNPIKLSFPLAESNLKDLEIKLDINLSMNDPIC
jgi:hypothetical protein